MITADVIALLAIGAAVLLQQRTQNNSLAKRIEDGMLTRISAVEARQDETESDVQDLRLDVKELQTVCKMRQYPRADTSLQGV